MSLWVRRAGHLIIAGALFFLSCEEDITLLGYKADQRFGVYFWDIPLESSVLFIDSLRTSNLSQETNRLLIGQYNDDLLGEVTTGLYSQYYRNGSLPDSLSFSTFDSVSLHLAFDEYFYGSRDATFQEYAVYELEEELVNVLSENPLYYANSVKQLGAQIGSKAFTMDPVYLEDAVENDLDTTYIRTIPLDPAFGQRLFDAAVLSQNADSPEDSVYVKLDLFIKEFKGISVQTVQGDKVYGINSRSDDFRIVVHFHLDNKRDSLELTFGNLAGYSTVLSEKAGSDVEGLTEYHQDFLPVSGNRYLENGVGLVTKVDLGNFINHPGHDTIPAMIINSAELRINNVAVQPKGQSIPTSAILRVLDENSRFRTVKTQEDTVTLTSYNQTVNSAFTILDDARRGDQLVMTYNEEDKTYSAFMTLFLQELYKKRETGPLLSTLAIFPISPPSGKTVNRSTFHQDDIKLRVYFTVPTPNTIE